MISWTFTVLSSWSHLETTEVSDGDTIVWGNLCGVLAEAFRSLSWFESTVGTPGSQEKCWAQCLAQDKVLRFVFQNTLFWAAIIVLYYFKNLSKRPRWPLLGNLCWALVGEDIWSLFWWSYPTNTCGLWNILCPWKCLSVRVFVHL